MIDRFETPWVLAALLAVPVVGVVMARRAGGAVLFSDVRLIAGLSRGWRVRLRWVPAALRLVALALLIVAVARPQKRAGSIPSLTEGIAIQLVVDRSGSMAEPFNESAAEAARRGEGAGQLTKLDAVKRLIRQFVLGDGHEMQGRRNDLLGLVTFARYADTACPLARSPEILVQLAEQTRVANGRAEDGTAIGDGLALAAARLKAIGETAGRSAEKGGKDAAASESTGGVVVRGRVVILLTDGQNNAGDVDPMQAAELAKSWGLRVYTIGLEGAPPARDGDPFANLRRSMGGVDEESLRRIAEMTGGKYFSASDSEALREVYATIDKIEKSKLSSPETSLYAELFPSLAMSGLLAFVAELVLSSTVLRRLP